MNPLEIFGTFLGAAIVLFLLFLAILWIVLPFVVYSIDKELRAAVTQATMTNAKMDHILIELRLTNQILKAVHNVAEE